MRADIARAGAAAGLRVTGYADLSVSEVAARTGLDEAAAARARQRDYSETLVDELAPGQGAKLEAALAAAGLRCQHGGRFRTVTAATADKGRAARAIAALFAAAWGRPPLMVGLGDSLNDRDLLATVDRAYLLSRDDGSWCAMDLPHLRRIARAGPHGWSDAVAEVLRDAG